MITDRIENHEIYKGISERIVQGLNYIRETDLITLEPGKYKVTDYITANINEYETKDATLCKPEAHKKFIDIQYMIAGEENIGYAPLNDQSVFEPYNNEKDLIFYTCEADYFKLKEGMFAIFFPGDLHMPGIKIKESKTVKKLVLKIEV